MSSMLVTQPSEDQRLPSGEDVVVLHPVSWSTFNCLLQELGDSRGQRLTYCDEWLEIMSPLGIHEHSNRFIEGLIFVMADELNLPLKRFGSLTLKLDNYQQGVEPDSCYYLHHESEVRRKQNIDLTVDPPPDLVLEIDISRPSIEKLPIYANLQVPEVWRYRNDALWVFVLEAETGEYRQVEASPTFPFLPLDQVPLFIQRSLVIGETATLKEFRQWVRDHANYEGDFGGGAD